MVNNVVLYCTSILGEPPYNISYYQVSTCKHLICPTTSSCCQVETWPRNPSGGTSPRGRCYRYTRRWYLHCRK